MNVFLYSHNKVMDTKHFYRYVLLVYVGYLKLFEQYLLLLL